jgi:hypothetical protein
MASLLIFVVWVTIGIWSTKISRYLSFFSLDFILKHDATGVAYIAGRIHDRRKRGTYRNTIIIKEEYASSGKIRGV